MKLYKLKVSKTLTRYVFSYILVFFLPLSFSFFIFNYMYLSLFQQQVELSHVDQTIKMRNSMDSYLEQIGQIAGLMMVNGEMQPTYNKNRLNVINSVKKLREYYCINNFIDEILYFQNDLSFTITSRGSYELDTLGEFYFEYKDWTTAKMLEDLFRIRTPRWLPAMDVRMNGNIPAKYLTYLFPLYSSNNIFSIAMFQINYSAFEKVLDVREPSESIVCILDSNGRIIYSSTNYSEKYRPILDSTPLTVDKPVSYSKLKNYFYSYAHSQKNDWLYVNILPMDIALAKVHDLQAKNLLLSFLLLLLGGVAIYIVSYLNYNPLKSLLSIIHSNVPNQDIITNEIEAAKKAVSYLGDSSRTMLKKIEKSSSLVKNSLLIGLLSGKYADIKDFNDIAIDYNIRFESSCLFIIVFAKEIKQCTFDETFVASSLEEYFQQYYEAYIIDNYDDQLIVICGDTNPGVEDIRQRVYNAQNGLKEQRGILLRAGISTFTNDPLHIYNKYIEALSVLEYSTVQSDIIAVVYGSDKINYSTDYPSIELEQLNKTILLRDSQLFSTVFNYLRSYILKAHLSLFIRLCISYDVINAILKAMQAIDRNILQEFYRNNDKLLFKSNNLNLLMDVMDKLHDLTVQRLASYNDGKEYTLIDQINTYIRQNFKEPNFFIQNVADHFGMSLSNLSHYYKKNSGKNISDFISDLRMDYAKELLSDSTYSLQDIIVKLGYTSMSSFIHKFKSCANVTPGEYRVMYTKK